MNSRKRIGTVLLSAFVAASVVPAATATATASRMPRSAPASSTDVTAGLAADGTFRGAPRADGAIDMGAWALGSDLAAGEPPRLVRRASAPSPKGLGPWSNLGSNGSGNGAVATSVLAITAAGPDLYVGGEFTDVAGNPTADFIVKWNGTAWTPLGSDGSGDGALDWSVNAIAVSGTDVYVGGKFSNAGGVATADFLARWNGTAWSGLGSNGAGDGALDSDVLSVAASGPVVYAGGVFLDAAGIATADNLARWSGTAWSALGSNGAGDGALAGASVYDVALAGTDVYISGTFLNVAGVATADHLARWNGTAWSGLGSNGSGNGALNDTAYKLEVSGGDVYTAGVFTNAGGAATADYLAKWNGTAWSGLGSNGSGDGALTNLVLGLAVSGPNVFVGGLFFDAAGIAEADYVARWNGTAWSALGSDGAGDGAIDGPVIALAPTASHLAIGGAFSDAAGIATADNIARWALPTVVHQPDGRIRIGSGVAVGNDIYNLTGAGQNRSASGAIGSTITFEIPLQNDATAAAIFKVRATGTATSAYTVKYFRGATEITTAVVAGNYQTTSVAPGASYMITAKVTVKATAAVGSNVTRLVTVRAAADPTKKDTVRFVAKRS